MAAPHEHQRPQLARGHRMQWEEVQNCHVLLYPEGMVTLNPSAYEILSRCDGQRSVAAIVSDLQAAFPGAQLTDEVWQFLGLAAERGWIELD